MREIKFRAWDIGGGRMEYKLSPINLEEMFLCHTVDLAQAAKEHGHVLMQFTGLKDKNGKEIYEGDVVRCNGIIGNNHYDNEVGVVVYDQRHGAWMTDDMSGGTLARTLLAHNLYGGKSWKSITEVIGNIHEHPELLEGGDK